MGKRNLKNKMPDDNKKPEGEQPGKQEGEEDQDSIVTRPLAQNKKPADELQPVSADESSQPIPLVPVSEDSSQPQSPANEDGPFTPTAESAGAPDTMATGRYGDEIYKRFAEGNASPEDVRLEGRLGEPEGGEVDGKISSRLPVVHVVPDPNADRKRGGFDPGEIAGERDPLDSFNFEEYMKIGRGLEIGTVIRKRGEGGMGAFYEVEPDWWLVYRQLMLQGDVYHPDVRIDKMEIAKGGTPTPAQVAKVDEMISAWSKGHTHTSTIKRQEGEGEEEAHGYTGIPDVVMDHIDKRLVGKKRCGIKVIEEKSVKESGDTANIGIRFKREAFIANRLDHKNIVKAFLGVPLEHRDENGTVLFRYILEELVEDPLNMEMGGIVKLYPRLSNEHVTEIGHKLFQALQHGHSQRPPIIHRDVSPKQALVESELEITMDTGKILKFDEEKYIDPLTQKVHDFDIEWKLTKFDEERRGKLAELTDDEQEKNKEIDSIYGKVLEKDEEAIKQWEALPSQQRINYGLTIPITQKRVVGAKRTIKRVLLTDYGMAKPFERGKFIRLGAGSTSRDASVTQSKEFAGTAQCVSSEQARSWKNVGLPSDYMSLGAAKFILATGKAPIDTARSDAARKQKSAESRSQEMVVMIGSPNPENDPLFPNQVIDQKIAQAIEMEGLFKGTDREVLIDPLSLPKPMSYELEDLIMLEQDKNDGKRILPVHIGAKYQEIIENKLYDRKDLSPEEEKRMETEGEKALEKAKQAETLLKSNDLSGEKRVAGLYETAAFAIPRMLVNNNSIPDFSREDAFEKAREHYEIALRLAEEKEKKSEGPSITPVLEENRHLMEAHKRVEQKRVDAYTLPRKSVRQELDRLRIVVDKADQSWSGWGFANAAEEWFDAVMKCAEGFIDEMKYNAATEILKHAEIYREQHTSTEKGKKPEGGRSLGEASGRFTNKIKRLETRIATEKERYPACEVIAMGLGALNRILETKKFKYVRRKLDEMEKESGELDKLHPDDRPEYASKIFLLRKYTDDCEKVYEDFKPLFVAQDSMVKKCKSYETGLRASEPTLFAAVEIATMRQEAATLKEKLLGKEQPVDEDDEQPEEKKYVGGMSRKLIGDDEFSIAEENLQDLAKKEGTFDRLEKLLAKIAQDVAEKSVVRLSEITPTINKYSKDRSQAAIAEGENLVKYLRGPTGLDNLNPMYVKAGAVESVTKIAEFQIGEFEKKASIVANFEKTMEEVGNDDTVIKANACVTLACGYLAERASFSEAEFYFRKLKKEDNVIPGGNFASIDEKAKMFAGWKKGRGNAADTQDPEGWGRSLASTLAGLNDMFAAYRRINDTNSYVRRTREGLDEQKIDEAFTLLHRHSGLLKTTQQQAEHGKSEEILSTSPDRRMDDMFEEDLKEFCEIAEERMCEPGHVPTYTHYGKILGMIKKNSEILEEYEMIMGEYAPLMEKYEGEKAAASSSGADEPKQSEDLKRLSKEKTRLTRERTNLLHVDLPHEIDELLKDAKRRIDGPEGIMQPANKGDFMKVAQVLEHFNKELAKGYFEQYMGVLPEGSAEYNSTQARVKTIEVELAQKAGQ